MNLQPQYLHGVNISLSEAQEKLSKEEFNELLIKGKGTIYYYEEEERYSHRKALPQIIDCYTGEVSCFFDS